MSLRITTPGPTQFSELNKAPSKFTLYWALFGGCQQVGGRPTSVIVEELWRAKSHNRSLTWSSNWSRETVAFPSLRLFLPFHKKYNPVSQ